MTTDRVVLRPLKLVSGRNVETWGCELERPRIFSVSRAHGTFLPMRVWKTSMLTEMQTAEAQPWVSKGNDFVESSARGLSSQNLAECCCVLRTSVRLNSKVMHKTFFGRNFKTASIQTLP